MVTYVLRWFIASQGWLPIGGAAGSLVLSLSLLPVTFWLAQIQEGEQMKSCCSSSHRIRLVAGTETRALSLCRKITSFGAHPSCLWVRGTANTRIHAHNPLITAQNRSENAVQLALCRKDSSILPLIQSSLLTWWKSTRQTVSHSEDTEPILATGSSLWDVSLWAMKPWSAPGSFSCPSLALGAKQP